MEDENQDLGNVGNVTTYGIDYAPYAVAGSGVLSNFLNPLWQWISDKRNYKYAQEAAERQNKLQLEWWNMQNEYNSPKAQLGRLVDAGLNPNLIYGQMQSSNAGDVGTPAVAKREYNVDYGQALAANLQQSLELMGVLEDLRAKKLANF